MLHEVLGLSDAALPLKVSESMCEVSCISLFAAEVVSPDALLIESSLHWS